MSSHAEQIKSRLSIADVAQTYIKLQKAGANFKANCPFHNEKTPSFFVSPARESWHCFGCSRGGDIFSFVMEIEGVEFPEALKILADRAGVELKPISAENRSERVRLSQLMDEAKKFYEYELKQHQDVIEYLKSRGLKGETAKEFGIGFVPDEWRKLHDFLKTKGFSGQEMEKAGMAIKPASLAGGLQKNHYDRFRSRIMFPLNNSSGQIVGFSGRIFGKEDDKTAKYINSPQTSLYDKSRILYGFDKAKMEIRKKDCCILVEGQMDVIMSHQAGLTNTVAVSGTALTEEHLRIIKRLTDNIIMAFDGDEAGLRASQRGIDLALAQGFEVKVAIPPTGKDPADAIQEDVKSWEEVVKNAKHVIAFYLDSLTDQKEIEKTVLPYIAVLPSEIEKAKWVKEVAKKLSVGEEPVWNEVNKIQISGPVPPSDGDNSRADGVKKTRLKMIKDRLLGFLIWQKNSEDLDLKKEMDEIIKKQQLDLGVAEGNLVFEAELLYNEANNPKDELQKLSLELEREEVRTKLLNASEEVRRLEMAGGDEAALKKSMDAFHELTKELNNLT